MNGNFITALAGFLSGLFGALGLGGGGVLIIYLTVFAKTEQIAAQGINILFFIPIALIAVLMYNRKNLVCLKLAIPYSILGIVGAIIGAMASEMVNSSALRKGFGGLLLVMGIKQLFSKSKK